MDDVYVPLDDHGIPLATVSSVKEIRVPVAAPSSQSESHHDTEFVLTAAEKSDLPSD